MSPEQREAQIIDVQIRLPDTKLANKFKANKAKVRHSSALVVQQLSTSTTEAAAAATRCYRCPSSLDLRPSPSAPPSCAVCVTHTAGRHSAYESSCEQHSAYESTPAPNPSLSPSPSPPPPHASYARSPHRTLLALNSRSLCVADASHNAVVSYCKRPQTVTARMAT